MHPVEHLDALVLHYVGQRLAPARIDHDGADRTVGTAALWALAACAPRSVDRADEIYPGIGGRRELDDRLAGSQLAFVRFAAHRRRVPGTANRSPAAITRRRSPP